MSLFHRIAWSALAVASLSTALAPRLTSQSASRHVTSPFLPSDHWGVAAARRVATLGLVDHDFGWGDGSLTTIAVGRVLHDAIAISEKKHPELTTLTQGYWARFTREFPAMANDIEPVSTTRGLTAEGWTSLGYTS